MNPWRKPQAWVAGALIAATSFIGTSFVRDVRIAHGETKIESRDVAKAEDLANVFRTVGKDVEPAVVRIDVKKTVKGVHRETLDDETLKKMFPDRDGDGQPDLPEGFRLPGMGGDDDMEQSGTGSGVIMEVDGSVGYVLTNNHVAGGASEMDITLADGREIKNGKLLGADAKSDLAVIKIEGDDLHAVKWGDSDQLEKGDWIMAFGSPFGYVGSMTHGIVSALNRQAGILGQQGYESFIQVDAPINPGNSGGPLVNVHGEVVGINTAIASRSGGFQGIGFAIPSNQAKVVYTSLKERGKVVRGWLGVSISDVARDLPKAKSFGYSGATGVLVEQTFENTPATDKLKPGDIVTSIDGKKVETVQQLRNAVALTSPDKEVALHVFRDGKEIDVPIKMGEQPDDLVSFASTTKNTPKSGEKATTPQLGMRLATVNDELSQKYNLGDAHDGAVITTVEPKSLAAKAGLRPGDMITRVGNEPVASAREAVDAIAKQDVKKGIRFYVTNRESSRFVFIQDDNAK